jgi:hypothetical protein
MCRHSSLLESSDLDIQEQLTVDPLTISHLVISHLQHIQSQVCQLKSILKYIKITDCTLTKILLLQVELFKNVIYLALVFYQYLHSMVGRLELVTLSV